MTWIPLSIFATVFGGAAWFCYEQDWLIPGAMSGVVMAVLAGTAFAEYLKKYWDDFSIVYSRMQEAKYTTPIVLIARALNGLHPENTKLLNRFTARAVWDVRINMETRERDVMLRGTNIHLGFVEFVLNNSTGGQLYPRWKFAEGSYEWDPYKQVTDREQHDEFELWLSTPLIIARSYDKAPAVFLPPWTPELVKEAMGIVDQIEFFSPKPDVSVKRLPAEKTVAVAKSAVNLQTVQKERPLSDEDMQKIKALETARNEMSVKDYLKSIGKTIQ